MYFDVSDFVFLHFRSLPTSAPKVLPPRHQRYSIIAIRGIPPLCRELDQPLLQRSCILAIKDITLLRIEGAPTRHKRYVTFATIKGGYGTTK